MYKRFLVIALMGLVMCSCAKSNEAENVVTNSIPITKEEGKYITKKMDFPYDKYTVELDYIAEESAGMLTNPSGEMEWITVSRAVKSKYKNQATQTIKMNKQLKPEWLECRVWKFSLSKDGDWIREAVGENAVTNEKRGINRFITFYHKEELYFVFINDDRLDKTRSIYTLSLFKLENNKWKSLNDFTCSDEDKGGGLKDPVNCFIDSQGLFDVANIDGEILKYDISNGKKVDESTDFKFDLAEALFDENYGYSIDVDNNEVLVYNMDTLIEDKRIKIPEKTENNYWNMRMDGDRNLYLFDKSKIYCASEGEESFELIGDVTSVDGALSDNMVLIDMYVVNKDKMYVYLYDNSSEEMKDYVIQIKRVGE